MLNRLPLAATFGIFDGCVIVNAGWRLPFDENTDTNVLQPTSHCRSNRPRRTIAVISIISCGGRERQSLWDFEGGIGNESGADVGLYTVGETTR